MDTLNFDYIDKNLSEIRAKIKSATENSEFHITPVMVAAVKYASGEEIRSFPVLRCDNFAVRQLQNPVTESVPFSQLVILPAVEDVMHYLVSFSHFISSIFHHLSDILICIIVALMTISSIFAFSYLCI